MKANPQLQLVEPRYIEENFLYWKTCFSAIIKDYENNVKERKKHNANVKIQTHDYLNYYKGLELQIVNLCIYGYFLTRGTDNYIWGFILLHLCCQFEVEKKHIDRVIKYHKPWMQSDR